MSAGGYARFAVETSVNSENTTSALSTVTFDYPATDFAWDKPAVLDDRSDELRGTFEAYPQDVVGFGPTPATLASRLYPNYMGVPLFMLLGAPTTTAGNGTITDGRGSAVPSGAYRHVWDCATVPALARSCQIQVGYPDQSAFFKIKGATSDGLTITHPDTTGPATMSSSIQACYSTDQADPSVTITQDAGTIKPFLRGHHTVATWLASYGTALNINYTFASPIQPLYSLASASKSPDNFDKTTPPVLTAQIKLRALGTADFNSFVGGTAFTTQTVWVHDQFVTGSYPYNCVIDGNAQYTALGMDSLKHQILHGQTLDVYYGKGAASSSFKITLCNGVSSYSSVS